MNNDKKGDAPLWLSFTSAVCVWAVAAVFIVIGISIHQWLIFIPAGVVLGAFTNIAIKIFILGLEHGFKTKAKDIL